MTYIRTVLLLCLCPTFVSAQITSYFLAADVYTSNQFSEIDQTSLTLFVNLETTEWIAWNEFSELTAADPLQPDVLMLGRPSIGINDFIRLTVTNPAGTSLTLDIDQNDNVANSFGQQAVIYGEAEVAPDVYRFNELNGRIFIFDEAGSHNDIFTSSGMYDFNFSFRNTIGTGGVNDLGAYLLHSVVPEPSAFSLMCGVGLLLFARRRK